VGVSAAASTVCEGSEHERRSVKVYNIEREQRENNASLLLLLCELRERERSESERSGSSESVRACLSAAAG
jgi:hypothetical protein